MIVNVKLPLRLILWPISILFILLPILISHQSISMLDINLSFEEVLHAVLCPHAILLLSEFWILNRLAVI